MWPFEMSNLFLWPCQKRGRDVQSRRCTVTSVYFWIPLEALKTILYPEVLDVAQKNQAKMWSVWDIAMLFHVMTTAFGITPYGHVIVHTTENHGTV